MKFSVVIPTYNPDLERLRRVVQALSMQQGSVQWELIVVDNNSSVPVVVSSSTLRAPLTVVSEPKPGLTRARLAGFRRATGDVLVFVDDDNVLAPDYLQEAAMFLAAHPDVVAVGGKSVPSFEHEPPAWIRRFDDSLALRDFGPNVLIAEWRRNEYPECAPIGAGMVIRRAAFTAYATRVETQLERGHISDRRGQDLSSGGDNDIILTALEQGGRVAYCPSLLLHHLIPAGRTDVGYLCRLKRATGRSWVAVLAAHDIRPWKQIPRWTLPLRKLKAYVTTRAWRGPVEQIEWSGRCGILEGQGDLGDDHDSRR